MLERWGYNWSNTKIIIYILIVIKPISSDLKYSDVANKSFGYASQQNFDPTSPAIIRRVIELLFLSCFTILQPAPVVASAPNGVLGFWGFGVLGFWG
ncbi:MAG: hypothetical protein P4L69_14905, partial [Desulfosporosinus sp.]|nr:hypothetical protein [Desulfosporosinus sp.]